jgi:hypothetical protein
MFRYIHCPHYTYDLVFGQVNIRIFAQIIDDAKLYHSEWALSWLYPGVYLLYEDSRCCRENLYKQRDCRERSMFPDSLRLRPARKLNCPLRKQSRESAKRRAASKLIHRLRFVSPRLLAKLGRAPQAFVWEHASLTSRGFASGFCWGSLKGGNGFCRKLRMRRESEVFKDDGLSDG